jgi:hypothetical protein
VTSTSVCTPGFRFVVQQVGSKSKIGRSELFVPAKNYTVALVVAGNSDRYKRPLAVSAGAVADPRFDNLVQLMAGQSELLMLNNYLKAL